jgi:hypothetical protein
VVGRDYSEILGVDGRIFELMFENLGEQVWTGFLWLGIGASGGLL